MSTARRDILLAIEKAAQEDWEAKGLHNWDAPPLAEESSSSSVKPPKYFTTFPFPYMNGQLHLGHGFSLTKSEFASRYHRMKGLQSLWAFGFHATGTPIAACAQKIAKEMELYGNPPKFPEDVMEPDTTPKDADLLQFKGKRGKSGPAKPQWVIMKTMGIDEKDIPNFADPDHWLNYFPPLALRDLKNFGCHIDFRRSFITTNRNPFFDRFVTWQFHKLRAANLLNFDKRYCVYSPWDRQPCADHDRASGEGVKPQEYTVVKLVVQTPEEHAAFAPFKEIIGNKKVILPGATLRPETVYGQTNCWVSPEITYKAYAVANKAGEEEIYIMVARAARNMAYQNFVINGKTGVDPEPLFEVNGQDMIGLPLSAPLTPYKTIYTLPMFTISEAKGTGVVMCVPSDSPDDYINFWQLQKKPEYRKKLGIKDEWIMPFQLIPIIDIPELGTVGAKFMCEKLKVSGPNAKDQLEEAKRVCYQAGFYKGVMITGEFNGKRVFEAKVLTQKLMEDEDWCIRYFEPTTQVMSRSGDECVVALCDQWYLEYGKAEWKKAVQDHLKKMNMFFPGVYNGFEESLNWLADWPCSRTFGLGTYMPCDPTHTTIIDSLSDSTIYMAYYSIARYVQTTASGELVFKGTRENAYGLLPEMFTDEVFDYIFYGTGNVDEVANKVDMPVKSLKLMRNDFTYWYPVDLRCSGKDLIQNHLTMFLYNHAAIWPEDESKWPQAIFCNGHIQVDGEKMAKSKGNFISVREAIDTYGADATRLACADAGDSLDDANFVRDTAAGFILKLTTLLDQAKEHMSKTELRSGEFNQYDRIFENTMNSIITRTENFYENMQFRMVLNSAFHELTNEFGQYKLNCDDLNVHARMTRRYYEVLTLMMAPLAPHFADHMWQKILHNSGNVVNERFPTPTAPLDYSLVVASRVMSDVVKEIRSQLLKNAKKRGNINEVTVFTRTSYVDWQCKALDLMHEMYDASENKALPSDLTKQILAQKPDWLTKDIIPDTMAFISFVRGNVEAYGSQAMSKQPIVNDYELLSSVVHNLCKLTGLTKVTICNAEEGNTSEHAAARRKCRPNEPTIAFPAPPKAN